MTTYYYYTNFFVHNKGILSRIQLPPTSQSTDIKNRSKTSKTTQKKTQMDADENLYTYKLVRWHISSLYSTLSLHKIFIQLKYLNLVPLIFIFFNAGSSRGDSRRKIFTSDSICEKWIQQSSGIYYWRYVPKKKKEISLTHLKRKNHLPRQRTRSRFLYVSNAIRWWHDKIRDLGYCRSGKISITCTYVL